MFNPLDAHVLKRETADSCWSLGILRTQVGALGLGIKGNNTLT